MNQALEPAPLRIGALEVDPDQARVAFGDRVIHLSPGELALLATLVANGDRVMSRDELARTAGLGRGRSVDVLLSNVRRALGVPYLRNVRSRGWILRPEALELRPAS
ncbi:MAG TPA: winged helix-turn-helix domain-containing protein [Actinomycetota bacterium]